MVIIPRYHTYRYCLSLTISRPIDTAATSTPRDHHRYNKQLVNRRARAKKAKAKLQGKQGIDPGQASTRTAQGSTDPDSLESVLPGTDIRLKDSDIDTSSPWVDSTSNEVQYTIDDGGFFPHNPPNDYNPASMLWWKDFEDQ